MKTRTLLLLTVLTLSCIQAKADLAPTVMLHRGGEVKTYMYYEVQKAVDDAVDGDTIYLSEGTFQPFNVNKRILVRGAGPSTIIEGSCIIDIPGTDKLIMPVLDALSFNGDIQVENAYNQFTLRKCYMTNLIFNDEEGKEFYDAKIDRCDMSNRLYLPNSVKEFNAINSRIYSFFPNDYKGHAKFEHCNFGKIIAPITGGEFYGSIIGQCVKLTGAKNTVNLIGCIIKGCYHYWLNDSKYQSESQFINSKSGGAINSELEDFYYTRYDYGNSALDGTKYGIYGGQHPFNRNPEIPGVTKHEFSIDAATRTMTVKLTVDKLDK